MTDISQLAFGFSADYKSVQENSSKVFSSIFSEKSASPIKRMPTLDEIKEMEAKQLNILRKHMVGKNTMIEALIDNEFAIKSTVPEAGKLTFKDHLQIDEFFTKVVRLKRYARKVSIENETDSSVDIVMLLPDNLSVRNNIKEQFNSSIIYGSTYQEKKKLFQDAELYCDFVTISDPICKDSLIPDRNLVNVTVTFKKFPSRKIRSIKEDAVGIETIEDLALYDLTVKLMNSDVLLEFANYDGVEVSLRCLEERLKSGVRYYTDSRTRAKLSQLILANRYDFEIESTDDAYQLYSELDAEDDHSYIKILKAHKIPSTRKT